MASQAQKRSASEQQNLLEGVKAVIVDIEGTTTPITFVHDKLFGYVRDNLKDYITSRWENEEVQADVEALRTQSSADKEAGVEGLVEVLGSDDEGVQQSVVDNVLWQMDNDRKATALKQLQGHMWREAYKTGKVQGEVFDDVVEAFKSLKTSETPVYIYSSGSVEAQKLLFGYSDKGDLSEYLAGYFDTTSGEKTSKDSYTTIVGNIGVSAGEALFLTDVTREAAPASEAGLQVAVVVREGNTALTEEERAQFRTITSFSQLQAQDDQEDGEPPAKRAAPEGEESNGAAEAAEGDDDDDVEEVDDDEVDEEELGDEEEEQEQQE